MQEQESDHHIIKHIFTELKISLKDLPYTPEFESAFDEYTHKSSNLATRHDFWELLLQVSIDPTEKPSTVAQTFAPSPPILPSKPENRAHVVETLQHQDDVGPLFQTLPKEDFASQMWTLKKRPPLNDDALTEAQNLLAAIARAELSTIEQKLAYLLMRFLETRDSDVALAIKFWTTFQADLLEKWDRLDLAVLYDLQPMTTIARLRAHIQNTLRLFVSSNFSAHARSDRQTAFSRYLAASRTTPPEIRIFLDETGDNAKTYTGLAGVCVMNWRQYEKYWAALTQWRQSTGWMETIHFADTGTLFQPRALELLSQLDSRKGGLLFAGYAISSRSQLHQTLANLFIQLTLDCLRHMRAIGCLIEPKSLTIVKEAEAGFDQLLPSLEECLSQQLSSEFPGQIVLSSIQPLPKGREVFLECADIIAGGMQRRAIYKGPNPKDVLAEAVFRVTGFEDRRDNGTVFKAYPQGT